MKKYLLIILLLPINLFAEETTDEADVSTWKGDVQFGYVATSGNTENSNLNSKLNIERVDAKWTHLFSAAAFSMSEDNETTAERFKLEYKASKKFTETGYFFFDSTYEEDKFSGFEYQATMTGGYGQRLYDANKMTFDAEIGAGMRQSEIEPDPVTGNVSEESEGLIQIAAKYLWQIEEKRSVTSDLTIDAGKESTITNLELGFVTMIAGDFSLKAAYTAKYTSEVPVDKEKLDTIVSLNLLYAF